VSHYRNLRVWQVAHALALEVSRAVDSFPLTERFELASHLRRVAHSVPTNLAEGQARYGPREALRFAHIAAGSLAEVEYLLLFAKEKGYLAGDTYDRLEGRREYTTRLLSRLIRSLRRTAD
jgi:carbamoyl-phosphate synthase large subunit